MKILKSRAPLLILLASLASSAIVYGNLLGELGQINFPATIFRPGTVAYDAGSGALTVNATAIRTLMSGSDVRPHAASPASTVNISAMVLNSGATDVQGVGANPLQVIGAFDVDGNGTIESSESGVMLTGNLVEVAYSNPAPGSGSDVIGMRFSPTGGFLMPFYAGRNIGVDVNFANNGAWPAPGAPGTDFASSFTATVTTSTIKPIPCGVQIGEFVWHDLNSNGLQDPGEPGLNGITVRLKDQSGNVVATAITGRGPLNQGGYYLFERVVGFCAGTYTVEVDPTTVPVGFYPTQPEAGVGNATDSTDSPATVVLAADNSADLTVDFGYSTNYDGSISGRIWHDTDGDGIQEAGEPGIDRVGVNAYNADTNDLVAQTVTFNGQFGFDGLDQGSYRIEPDLATVPRGFAPTISDAGADNVDSDLPSSLVTLDGLHIRDQNTGFGYISVCTGVIGNYIWYDKNQNGVQDAGETGISAVDVSLVAEDGSTVATTTSGANGAYSFTGVCGGTYSVVVDQADLPAGFTPTVVGAGSQAGKDSNGSPAVVVLASNTTDESIDLGFVAQCAGTIGDRVWYDSDHDGIQDAGEPGFAGATVNLRRRHNNVIIQSDITGADGAYLFTGLCPGSYVVELSHGGDITDSATLVGGNRDIDNNQNPDNVDLVLDDSADLSVDFGLYTTAAIGDTVWNDVDGLGTQSPGEPGIAGVVVTLNGPNGLVRSTITDATGHYYFGGLMAATYQVSVALPAGCQKITIERADPQFDSNRNPTSVTLPSNDYYDAGIDFGFICQTAPPPPPPVPGIKIVKTANKNTVVYGEEVTFTYKVTNTGTTTLTNIVVTDDNATPTYRKDDFTVGTLASLAPGASHSFSKTVVPPAKMCNTDGNGKTRKCGMMLFKHLSSHVEFTYLQSRDHRDDYWSWSGWHGKRSYTKKGKFRITDLWDIDSEDVKTESMDLDDDDGDEYVSAYKVTANKNNVSGNGYVKAPKIYHKKGWDGDWRDDWDYRWWGNYNRGSRWDDDRHDRDNDHDYDYGKHPKLCPTTSTNVGTVTAKSGSVSLKATDKETVQIVGPAVTESFKTFTQGSWGAKPSGNNPGKFLADKFSSVFPAGYVVIGGTKTIKLTSASAIEKFLPQSGTAAKLTQNYTNPTTQLSVLAGQVLALKLNVAFSVAGKTRTGLGNLTVVSGELVGKTVNQVLAIGNSALGGGSLPSGLTLSELNGIISKINENFEGQNNGYLED